MPLFTRSPNNPILTPSDRWWESRAVLNPGAAVVGDRIALVYRAVGADGISRFGLAWTGDGETIEERSELPFYEAALDDPMARLGVEDPRITQIDGSYHTTYCKASVDTADTPPLSWETAPFRIRTGIGTTKDFRSMREVATLLPETNTKDGVLFPEKIGGRYVALVREYPSIQYVTSSDLLEWSEPVTMLRPRRGRWDGERIGAGPPPLRTPSGWLVLYHGNEYLKMPGNRRLYRMGLALFDRTNLEYQLWREPEPIFWPEAEYETDGPVGNVVFGTGLVEMGEKLFLYYGAGDGVIGVATAEKAELYEYLERKVREESGPPPRVPNPGQLAAVIAENPIYQQPSPSPVYITQEEALRIAGVKPGTRAALKLLQFGEVDKLDPGLQGNALVPHARIVWVVAVAADITTRGSLVTPPQTVHGYSVVIDAETGHAFTLGAGMMVLDVP